MNIEHLVETLSTVTNAAGQYYLEFPYTSSIGRSTAELTVHVPINHQEPSAGDRKALVEAVKLQGNLGRWTEKADGSVWLVPT